MSLDRAGGASSPGLGWRFVTPLYIGSSLNPINSSLIATALIPISHGIGASAGQVTSLVAALYLASAVAQPTAGRVADLIGAKRVLVAGYLLVLAGGIVGGLVPTLPGLLVSRVLIGIGTSSAFPTSMVLIRERAAAAGLPGPPGGVIGGLQIASVATASLGLPLGGLLVQIAGWRAVFVINVPLALIALITSVWWLPRNSRGPVRSSRASMSALDLPGLLGFATAMTVSLLFVFSLPEPSWWLLAGAAVLWLAEVGWELRARTPFLDVRALVSNGALERTYLRYGLVLLGAYLALYGVTQWLQVSRGVSAVAAGLLLLPMTVVSGVVVPPIMRSRRVFGPLAISATALLAAGAATFFLPTPAWLPLIIVSTTLLGLATGCDEQLARALRSSSSRRGRSRVRAHAVGRIRRIHRVLSHHGRHVPSSRR